MIKYYCDRCNNEMGNTDSNTSMYRYLDNFSLGGNEVRAQQQERLYCGSCTLDIKKFLLANVTKDDDVKQNKYKTT